MKNERITVQMIAPCGLNCSEYGKQYGMVVVRVNGDITAENDVTNRVVDVTD